LVCRLHKSFYGLKQAPSNWFHKFFVTIQKAGFTQSLSYYSLFTRTCGTSFTIILIYIDDMVITGNDESDIHNLKSFLHNQFHIKDLGHLKYILGLEIARSKGIVISQRKYTFDILNDTCLHAQPVDFPMEQNLKLTNSDGEVLNNPSRFRRFVGRLIYLTVTRP
jgi:E3 ubiquitin-protein ligase DOA10